MGIEDLERKARTTKRREGARRAVLVYRRICDLYPESAKHWTLLGATLLEAGRIDEGAEALRTAIWLRMRSGEVKRAASIARLLLSNVESDRTAERAMKAAALAA